MTTWPNQSLQRTRRKRRAADLGRYASRSLSSQVWCWLLLPLLATLASVAYGAAADRPQILGYTSSGSFWLEMPDGWENDGAAAKRTGAIFVLRPIGTNFDTAPFVLVASKFSSTTVEAAIKQDAEEFLASDPKMAITTLAPIRARKGGDFALRDFRSEALRQQGFETAAYIQLGPDVVVVVFSAQTRQNFDSGRPIFITFLKSYEVSDMKVRFQE